MPSWFITNLLIDCLLTRLLLSCQKKLTQNLDEQKENGKAKFTLYAPNVKVRRKLQMISVSGNDSDKSCHMTSLGHVS